MSRGAKHPLLLALLLLACQPITVRVGKRHPGAEAEPSFPYNSDAIISDAQTWNSVEDFLQNLDAIKTLGREAMLKRYHEDGRQQIRGVFREFRNAVESHATADFGDRLPYLGGFQAGTCVPIQVNDIFELGPYGDLRSLLETVFLNKIKPTEILPDLQSPGNMDEVTKLGFFELGIGMDGLSYFEVNQDKEMQGSDLRWKVIHEQSEPEELALSDEQSVKFSFTRVHEQPDHNVFNLDARVGSRVFEDQDEDSLPSLMIEYQRINNEAGESFQEMHIKTGLRRKDSLWETLQFSRNIIVSQDIKQGHILHVTVVENYQQPDEHADRFRIDMNAQNLCSEIGGQ